ncbi:MAG: antA/AntB antirepressor family protein [Bacteroidota bacterium]
MELIKIYQGNLVDARELHNFLGSKQEFANWIRNRIKRYGFEEGQDYTSFDKFIKREKGGSKRTEYALTLNMAKELAMVENNEKGRQARRYFIEAEKTLQQLKENKRLESFLKLEATKDRFSKNVAALGGTNEDYIQIDYDGRKVFFNGEPIPDSQLSLVLMKGRDLAVELTNENIKEGITSLDDVEALHKINHNEVRNTIISRSGKKPEELKPEDEIKNLGAGDKE